MDSVPERPSGWRRYRHWLGALAVLLAFAASAVTRIGFTLRDPAFQGTSAAALLRTDPAFLYYVTERIVENGGRVPASLRADPNVEWPDVTDVLAIETVGQELFVAWTYLLLGKPMALHLWALWAMGLWTSLVALGVYGIAYELTGKVRWASAAALLWAAMLVDYRTLGFVLIREDFAFPWLAAHLWLALRAARVQSWTSIALAGLTLLAAAATWHAAVFVLLIEAACVLAWTLRSGDNPLGKPRAWLALALPIALSLAVPVLRAKHFAFAAPMAIFVALIYAGQVQRRAALSRSKALLHLLAALIVLATASALLSRALGGGAQDYGHVASLLWAKLTHLGQPPSDPRELDFGARLLWQGPFRTADPRTFTHLATAGVLATLAAPWIHGATWLRGRGDARVAVALAFTLAAALATWLVERTAPLFGLASAALFAVVLDALRSRQTAFAIALIACVGHGVQQVYMHGTHAISWYQLPPRAAESEHLVQWLARNVPDGEAVASDYSTSATILAFARRPILNQPKYETRRSRDKIEEFCRAFYAGSAAELAGYLERQRCRWLVINRPFLGGNATELGGIRPEDLPRLRDRPCWRMMSEDPAEFPRVQGFTLVYESPRKLGAGSYRVYRRD